MLNRSFPRRGVFLGLLMLSLLLGSFLAACGGETSPTSSPSGNPTPAMLTTAAATTSSPTQSAGPTIQVTTTQADAQPSASTLASATSPTTSASTTPTAVLTQPEPTTLVITPAQPRASLAARPSASAIQPILRHDFSGDAAFAHVKQLAGTIGIRAAGTDGERKAGDYIEGYFKDLGLFTERPGVDYTTSSDGGSTVSYQATGGGPVTFKANALAQSSGGTVQGQLADVGLALPGTIPTATRGRIALVQRGQITFQEKVNTALKSGATAVLIYNNQDGSLDSATLQQPVGLPVLGLSRADGERLKKDLAANPNLSVNVNSRVETKQINLQNVVGRRAATQGDPATAPILIIGGHYDSVPAGPGANDNASGTAIMMELARDLQGQYPNFELRYIAFSGEEIGLVGSRDYANKLTPAERKRVRAMINVDMVTVGADFYVGGSPDLLKLGLTAATAQGAGNVQVIPAGLAGASDHASFADIGLPVLFFNRENDPDYHRATDTFDHVKPDRLEQVGRIVTQVIDSIART